MLWAYIRLNVMNRGYLIEFEDNWTSRTEKKREDIGEKEFIRMESKVGIESVCQNNSSYTF